MFRLSMLLLLFIASLLIPSAYPTCPSSPNFLYTQPPTIPSNLWQPIFNIIENRLEEQWKIMQIPCLSALITYKDQVIWRKSFGIANTTTGEAANSDTLYRIASITKVFTALMLFIMRDQGYNVQIDTPVKQLEPRFIVQNPFNTSLEVTMGQLASHMAGLFNSAPCEYEPNCTADEVYSRLPLMSLIYPPNYRPSYSNFGFAALGRVLENLLPKGVTYEDFIVSNILNPLNMKDSGFFFTPDVITKMAMGNGNSSVFTDSGYDSPNGQMYSSVNDLGKFIIGLLHNDKKSKWLDSGSIKESMLARYVWQDGATAMGMPWESRLVNEYWKHTKIGQWDGFSSSINLVPELSVGMALATNLDYINPDQLTAPAIADLITFLKTTIPIYQPITYPLPSNVQDYIGIYHNNDYGTVIITTNPNHTILYATIWELKGQLRWISGSNFIFFQDQDENEDCFDRFYDASDGISVMFNVTTTRTICEGDVVMNCEDIVINSLTLPGSTWWGQVFTRVQKDL